MHHLHVSWPVVFAITTLSCVLVHTSVFPNALPLSSWLSIQPCTIIVISIHHSSQSIGLRAAATLIVFLSLICYIPTHLPYYVETYYCAELHPVLDVLLHR